MCMIERKRVGYIYIFFIIIIIIFFLLGMEVYKFRKQRIIHPYRKSTQIG